MDKSTLPNPARAEKARRRRRWRSRLSTIGGASLTVLLVVGLFGLAVYRAFPAVAVQPTPTLPADLDPNVAYVSGLRGLVESLPPGAILPVRLRQGDQVGAGLGALLRSGSESWMRLGLLDVGVLFLGENSELELRQIGDPGANVTETVTQLNYGRALVVVGKIESQSPFIVMAETGARAMTEDAVMGVTYDRDRQRFELHCLTGVCQLSGDGETLSVEAGRRGLVQGDGAPILIGPAQYELFQRLGDRGLIPTATATRPAQPTATAVESQPDRLVTIAPTEPRPTFTPRPSRTATPAASPSATPTPLTTVTVTPTIPAATNTAVPTAIPTTPAPPSATATAVPSSTPTSPAPTSSPTPTGAATASPTAVPTGTAAGTTPTATPTPGS